MKITKIKQQQISQENISLINRVMALHAEYTANLKLDGDEELKKQYVQGIQEAYKAIQSLPEVHVYLPIETQNILITGEWHDLDLS